MSHVTRLNCSAALSELLQGIRRRIFNPATLSSGRTTHAADYPCPVPRGRFYAGGKLELPEEAEVFITVSSCLRSQKKNSRHSCAPPEAGEARSMPMH